MTIVCYNSCNHDRNSICDDGGSGSESAWCTTGTDCFDCGPRVVETGYCEDDIPTLQQIVIQFGVNGATVVSNCDDFLVNSKTLLSASSRASICTRTTWSIAALAVQILNPG